MFGKKRRVIAEQEERIKALEQQVESLNSDNKRLKDRVIDVERRERGIGRTLNEAAATAEKMISEAQQKSDSMLNETQVACDSLREKAESVVEDAYRSAREIVREAEEEGAQKRADMQQQIEQYAALLRHYDAVVQEQLQSAESGAKRFAELARSLHESVPQLLGADGSPLLDAQTSDAEPEKASADIPEAPDYEAHPLSITPSRESGDEQLWTVDKIAGGTDGDIDSDVDAIIDEILAATEDDA